MALLLKLPLLHGTQAADATDTAMHLIATSEHARLASLGNACTKPNQRLACNFLNFLAYILAFNEFAVRERIASEDKEVVQAIGDADDAIAHNYKLLGNYLCQIDEAGFLRLFPSGKLPAPKSTHAVLQRRRDVYAKLGGGVCMSFHPPTNGAA